MIVDNGCNIELFETIVRTLPNHTQKMRHRDKCYEDTDICTYDNLYNKTLGNALSALWKTQVKDKLNDYQRAIWALATKAFPLTKNNIRLIKATKLTHLFDKRLDREFNPTRQMTNNGNGNKNEIHGQIDTLAHQRFLHRSGPVDTISRRISLYYEIADYFVIPESVTDYMVQVLHETHEKKQFQRQLPQEEEFTFFENLYQSQSSNHQKLFWFFNHYYALDKLLFYKKMDNQFITDEHLDNSHHEEQKSVRKMKI
jgi:hypothetical protein